MAFFLTIPSFIAIESYTFVIVSIRLAILTLYCKSFFHRNCQLFFVDFMQFRLFGGNSKFASRISYFIVEFKAYKFISHSFEFILCIIIGSYTFEFTSCNSDFASCNSDFASWYSDFTYCNSYFFVKCLVCDFFTIVSLS